MGLPWHSGKECPLLIHRTRVRPVVQEYSTCWGATEPLCCNSWGRALELVSHNSWACVLQQEQPPQWEAHTPQLESSLLSPQLKKDTPFLVALVWWVKFQSLPPGKLTETHPCNTSKIPFILYISKFLENKMATHSSVLAWRIPGMGEPGGLQSTGSQRVGHDWVTSLSLSIRTFLRA